MEVENNKDSLRIESVGGGTNIITLKEGTIVIKHEKEMAGPPKTPVLPDPNKPIPKNDEKKQNPPKRERTSEDIFVPTGEYDFLDTLNGRVKIKLFNEKTFVMEIKDGYVEIQPFLEDVTDYLQEKEWGRADWVLGALKAGEYSDESGNNHFGITSLMDSEVFRLINTPNEVDIVNGTARLSKMLESIKYDNQFKKADEGDFLGFGETTENQIYKWLDDEKNVLLR